MAEFYSGLSDTKSPIHWWIITPAFSSHPEHEENTDWYDGNFEPNTPETDILNFEVMRLAKKWKPRKAGN